MTPHKRNQSLNLASKASIGKSVSARTMNEPSQQASRFVSAQVSFHGAREATIATEVSLSGAPGDWIEIGRKTFTVDDKSQTYESPLVFTFVRSVLVEDVEALVPVSVAAPVPVIEETAVENADGSSVLTSTITTPAPPPVPVYGVSTFVAGY